MKIEYNQIDKIFSPFISKRKRNSLKRRFRYLIRDIICEVKIFIIRIKAFVYKNHSIGVKNRKLIYEEYWDKISLEKLAISSDGYKKSMCVWNGEYMQANPIGIKRVHLYYLVQLIEKFRPTSVLEVGSGQGLNLFVLARLFPEIKFTGIELTDQGIYDANRIKNLDVLPTEIISFSPLPTKDNKAHKEIIFYQGSADKINLDSNSFDLVFTRQALEQMNSIKYEVISELKRISNKHIVMFEAFREWNERGFRRFSILKSDMFEEKIKNLKKIYDLNPILIDNSMPTKAKMCVGLVICEVHN